MSKRKLSVKLFALFFACLILCCSCAKKSDEERHKTESISFCDALGVQVEIPKGSMRAACLTGSFAEVWQLSGGTVCASADGAWDDLNLSLPDAVNIGKSKAPDLEKIVESEPDFVIASADTAANVEMKDALSDMGIPVVFFEVDNFEDYLSMLDTCTDITGRKDLYEKNGLEVKMRIDKLKNEAFSKELPQERKTVLFLRASAGHIRAKNSEGTILGEMISELSFINIADDDELLLENLSIESIIEKDPYRIFIVKVGDDEDAVQKNIDKMMEENPAWLGLSAVKENRVHYLDNRLFNFKPNALWDKAYETLIKILFV